jgi:hypothetical protein
LKAVFDERGFASIDFAGSLASIALTGDGYVYALCLALDGREIPFYIGETGRLARRMGDYVAAQFAAPTDFRVGTAAFYLAERGTRIIVRYKHSETRKQDEQDLIPECVIAGYHLLNCVPSYSYSTASRDAEKQKVVKFCEMLLRLL